VSLVEKVKNAKSQSWRYVPGAVKAVHAIGRTCPQIGTLATKEMVDELVEMYGMYWEQVRGDMSLVQQLDHIATEILRRDREANISSKHSARRNYLSPGQWYERARREIPWPNIEDLVDAMRDPRWVRRHYEKRVVDIPWDKVGDHYNVWIPRKVKIESQQEDE